MDNRISKLREQFDQRGFRLNDSSNTPGFPFLYSASGVRFDYVGIPTFLEEFFIFEELSRLTSPLLHRFLDDAWEWALGNENMMPRTTELSKKAMSFVMNMAGGRTAMDSLRLDAMSARQVTCLVYVYPVAISDRITREVMEWVWSRKSPRRQGKAAQRGLVIPVVYDSLEGEFHHFRRRPILGNVYYTEARKALARNLPE